MKKERNVWAITSIVLWWLAPNIMQAQQDSIATLNLSEVVVTATRFHKNQSETGKVLTVISREQLEQSAGKDLSQVLNQQVGLVVNGANSNPGKDKSLYLRGATNAYTLILMDGVPLNDPSGVTGGAYDLRLINTDWIDHIEILKGSQSTLYGSDAIAGVINIITKTGDAKPVTGSATASFGNYGTFKGNADVAGSSGILDYRVGYTRVQTNGISEAKDPTGKGNFDKDGFNQNSFQASLGFKPVKGFDINPYFRYADFDGKYDGGAQTDNSFNSYQSKLLNTGASAHYRLNKGSVNLLYAHDNTHRTFDDTYGKSAFEGAFNNTDIFFNYDLAKYFQLLTGVNHQQWKMTDTTATVKNPTVGLTSAYTSFFVRNLGGFAMELGGRYNHHSKYGENFTNTVNPSYLAGKQLKLFVNYSTGYKAPSLYQLYGLYGANPNLKPEKSETLEGGVQFLSPDKKFDVRVVAFSRKVKDVIIYSVGSNGNGVNTNFDRQDDHGLEIEPNLKLTNRLTVSAFYAYVTGRVNTRTFDGADTTYNNLIRRPKNSFGFNAAFQATSSFSFSLNLKLFGERKDIYFDLSTFENKSTSLKGYALLDVHGQYSFMKNRLSVFTDLRNVLNQNYEEVYGYSTMGFNFTMGLGLKL